MELLGLLKRLSSSLFSPKDIIKYRTDRVWITFLYFILLLLLSILPMSILVFKSEAISYEVRREIITIFSGEDDIPFMIVDGKLVHDINDDTFVYTKNINSNLKVIITTSNTNTTDVTSIDTNVLLREDGVYLTQSALSIKLFDYSEYSGLNGLDFSNLKNKNDNSWNIVFNVINKEAEEIKPVSDVIQVVMIALTELISMILISVLLAFFQSFSLSGVITFGKIWKMCIYVLAPFVIGNVLGVMFNFALLFYVGLGFSALYAASISQNILRESSRKDRNNDL